MTVFAPTDNAFSKLKVETLNDLTDQEQVQLVQYHILVIFYKLNDLLMVSNPVRTQASSSDGGSWGLNFTGRANQVNVSTGLVETQVNNALRLKSPLAVYQLDQVLLPNALFGVKSPSTSPVPSSKTPSSSSNTTREAADGPTSASPVPSSKTIPSSSNTTKAAADGPTSASPVPSSKTPSSGLNTTTVATNGLTSEDNTGSSWRINVGLGLVAGLALFCMGVLS